jgi:hypothetical protein
LNFADVFQKNKFEIETILENDENPVTDLIQTSVLKNVAHIKNNNKTLSERHNNPRE